VISAGIIIATLFTLWTPTNLFSDDLFKKVLQNFSGNEESIQTWPTPTPAPRAHIGIIAGHSGPENDPGAVCDDDGLTERELNMTIATLVRQNLIKEGYEVDLLEEFDDRLTQYQALALISIHNDSCVYYGDQATGYKLTGNEVGPANERTKRLMNCMINRYNSITQMPYHRGSITDHMRNYHAFNQINSNTPAIIIETGFMNMDKQILRDHPEIIAEGITSGILCYVRNEPLQQP
jgi:N-acetylmuramoyl-L-alanine amidase